MTGYELTLNIAGAAIWPATLLIIMLIIRRGIRDD